MLKRLIGNIKKEVKILKGEKSRINKSIQCNHHWYGKENAGFYVCPDHLNKDSIVYSFGIGEDMSFDQTIIENHQCKVFGFDPTPKSITWYKKQKPQPNFTFLEYGIDTQTGVVNFNLPTNDNYVSGSIVKHKNVNQNNTVAVPMKCMADIIKELGHTHIAILKMDIEGSEYEVMDSILAAPITIDQILIEIHERFFTDGLAKTKKMLQAMEAHGYAVFGVSDSLEEISFIKEQ